MAGVRGFHIKRVAETGSTNSDLLAAAKKGAQPNTVLVADFQRAGRGRRGRAWGAAPGSALLFSVLTRYRIQAEAAHLVATGLALAASEACDRLAGVRPALKWPNDLVVGDRKLAGVLAESVVAGERLEAVVVGMGLNVRADAAPAEVADTAAALETLRGAAVDRDELLAGILTRFAALTSRIESPEGQAELVVAARRESATLGRRVAVERADATVLEGQAVDLDDRGALVLEGGTTVVVGDVVHLRNA